MKYIFQNWVNGDFVFNALRTITRENKKYFIADVQRTAKDWKKEPIEYVFVYKWAEKYFKDKKSEFGFRRSITRLSNTDGKMTYTVTDDPSTLLCKYSLKEVFDNDLRDIQQPDHEPLRRLLYYKNELKNKNVDFKIQLYLKEEKENKNDYDLWDLEFVNYLRKLFKRNTIYTIHELSEYRNQSILTKSATLFHVNHFHLDKKSISFDENYFNRTILFWLFDDCLVFKYEEGKDTF